MEENKETTESVFSNPVTKSLLVLYGSVQAGGQREMLTQMLLPTNNSYYIADKIAAGVCNEKVDWKTSYSGKSGRLMKYAFDTDSSGKDDEIVLDILSAAINEYLSDKMDISHLKQSVQDSTIKKVKALMIQLISTGSMDMINDINIPSYVAKEFKGAQDRLNEGAMNAFNSWIDDLENLGNEHLIDYINTIGPSIFGVGLNTTANDKYGQFMGNQPLNDYFKAQDMLDYLSGSLPAINNPIDTYESWKKRRNEYNNFTCKIQRQDLYEFFGITESIYTKAQKALYDEFQLIFSENTNVQYLKRLFHGV